MRLRTLLMVVAMAMLAVPAQAQDLGLGSDGEKFLKALEDQNNGEALPYIQEPGSRVVNYRGYKGDTPLLIVTRNRDLTWVRYLLGKGADANIGDKQGDTPLILASRIGFYDAAEVMLAVNARVDETNRQGETALIVAVQQRQPRIVRLLLEYGANPDKTDHVAGLSARDYAKRDTRNTELLQLIQTVKSTVKKKSGPTL